MADLHQTPPTPTAASPPSIFPDLPDDISLQILARLSRCTYPSLSLVSKSWRSAISSPDLYTTRSLIGTTETSLYLNLRINSSFHWFFQPNPASSDSSLIPLPTIPQNLVGSSIAVLSPKIYVIGGSIDDISTNSVWIFDCRFRKWEMGPKMKVSREFSAAEAWGRKIYVIGGCNIDSWTRSENWAEVFEERTGTWAAVPSGVATNTSWVVNPRTGGYCPSGGVEVRGKWMHASAVIGSRVYAMADRGGVVLDCAAGEWGNVPKRLDMGWRGRAAVVDGVLYCYDYVGKIRGYDAEADKWNEIRGVGRELPKFMYGATLVNLDGKLCAVWERKGNGKRVDIMCAKIEVRKDVDGGLSGTVLSLVVVLVLPKGASISHCLAVRF